MPSSHILIRLLAISTFIIFLWPAMNRVLYFDESTYSLKRWDRQKGCIDITFLEQTYLWIFPARTGHTRTCGRFKRHLKALKHSWKSKWMSESLSRTNDEHRQGQGQLWAFRAGVQPGLALHRNQSWRLILNAIKSSRIFGRNRLRGILDSEQPM